LELQFEQKIAYNLRRRRRKGKWTRKCHQSSEKIAKAKIAAKEKKQVQFQTSYRTVGGIPIKEMLSLNRLN